MFVRAVRKNGFDGGQLAVDGLPAGVTAECGRIPAGKGEDGCIILTAAPDAAMGAGNIRVTGTASLPVSEATAAAGDADAAGDRTKEAGPPVTMMAEAQPMQETYMPGGGRSHWPVAMHAVAIGPAESLQVGQTQYSPSPSEAGTVRESGCRDCPRRLR
ncbi:MAG: hypothetical protein R3C49_16135 [Planctomycetaceae bacterium]